MKWLFIFTFLLPALAAGSPYFLGIRGKHSHQLLEVASPTMPLEQRGTTIEVDFDKIHNVTRKPNGDFAVLFFNGDRITGTISPEFFDGLSFPLTDVSHFAIVTRQLPDKGLLLHYTFNESKADAVNELGDSHTGNINGPSHLKAWKGKTGVISFDGDGDWVAIPYDPALAPTDGLTISAWLWREDWGSADSGIVISNAQMGGYALGINLGMSKSVVDGWISREYQYFKLTTDMPDDKGWKHLVLTADTTQLLLYVDGTLVEQLAHQKPSPISYLYENAVMIGADAGTKSKPDNRHWLKGKLDDIMIWDRPLKSQEITSLYWLQLPKKAID